MQHLKVVPQENGITIQEFLQHLNHYAVVDTAQKKYLTESPPLGNIVSTP